MKAELVSLDGGRTIPLQREITVIGRDESCDVFLNYRSVSKLHCVLVKSNEVLAVRDLMSTNGTKVNGQQILRAMLLPGDRLSIGGKKYLVSLGADDAGDALQRTEVIPTFSGKASPDKPTPSPSPAAPPSDRPQQGQQPSQAKDSGELPVANDSNWQVPSWLRER